MIELFKWYKHTENEKYFIFINKSETKENGFAFEYDNFLKKYLYDIECWNLNATIFKPIEQRELPDFSHLYKYLLEAIFRM